MNKVILMGRLTRDPDVRWPQNEGGTAVARYTLAVDRARRQNSKEGEQTADFIPCVTFGKTAEFVSNYLKKGTKVAISGRIVTGSYVNKEGQRVFTTEVIVDEHEFAERRSTQDGGQQQQGGYQQQSQGYQNQGGYQQNQGYQNQGGYPPQGQGYQQQQQGGYQQQNQGGYPPQGQGYQQQQQGGYQQQNQGGYPPQGQGGQMTPPDDFGFGGFDEELPFN